MKKILLVCTLLIVSCTSRKDPVDEAKANGVAAAIVKVMNPNQGGGTGYVIRGSSGQAVLLTNNHVCNSSDELVASGYGMKYQQPLKKLYQASWHDICVLEAPFELVDNALILSVVPPKPGQSVYVIGHPYLRPLTVTSGHLFGYGLFPVAGNGILSIFYAYYSETFVAPGSSGSPVLNYDNEVVAMVFAGSEMESLFIPYTEIQRVLIGF